MPDHEYLRQLKKEIIWNLCLLTAGVLFTLAFTLNLKNTAITIMPGGHGSSQFSPLVFWPKIQFGLIIGICLMLFRYIIIEILTIQNKDLKLLVLLLGYSIPILVLLAGLHYYKSLNLRNSFKQQRIPVFEVSKKIKEYRKAGLYKNYASESDNALTQILIGKSIMNEKGLLTTNKLWSGKNRSVVPIELLKLDEQKTWHAMHEKTASRVGPKFHKSIERLRDISDGNFRPSNIEILINEIRQAQFDIEGETHSLDANQEGEIKLREFVKYVNSKILQNTDFKFYQVPANGFLIIGLYEDEKKEIENIEGIILQDVR